MPNDPFEQAALAAAPKPKKKPARQPAKADPFEQAAIQSSVVSRQSSAGGTGDLRKLDTQSAGWLDQVASDAKRAASNQRSAVSSQQSVVSRQSSGGGTGDLRRLDKSTAVPPLESTITPEEIRRRANSPIGRAGRAVADRDPWALAKAAASMVGGLIQGGADSTQQAAQTVAAPMADVIRREFPSGILLKPETEKALRGMGLEGKTFVATVKNLDPSQMPEFVAQLTREAEGKGNSGARQLGEALLQNFRNLASTDPVVAEDAAAEIMGGWNALLISIAAPTLKGPAKSLVTRGAAEFVDMGAPIKAPRGSASTVQNNLRGVGFDDIPGTAKARAFNRAAVTGNQVRVPTGKGNTGKFVPRPERGYRAAEAPNIVDLANRARRVAQAVPEEAVDDAAIAKAGAIAAEDPFEVAAMEAARVADEPPMDTSILLRSNPDDPRFDPFADEFDEDVFEAVYQELWGRRPERDPLGEIEPREFKRLQDGLYTQMNRIGADEASLGDEFGDYIKRMYQRLTSRGKREHKIQWDAPGTVYRMVKRRGKWYADMRSPVSMAGIDGLPLPLQQDIIGFALREANDEITYATYASIQRWKREGGKSPGGIMRQSEWMQKETHLDDIETTETPGGIESNLDRAQIPRTILTAYAKTRWAKMQEAERARRAASVGINEDEFEAAVAWYNSRADGNRGAVEEGGADAIPGDAPERAGAGSPSAARADADAAGPTVEPAGSAEPAVTGGRGKGPDVDLTQEPGSTAREVWWRGKTYTFPTRADEELFDAITKAHKSEVRQLERQIATETDPTARRQLDALLRGKRSEMIEARDNLFNEIENRPAADAMREMDQEFLNAVARDADEAESGLLEHFAKGMGQAGAGIDPVFVAESLGKLARAAVAKGREFTEWAAEAVGKFGQGVMKFLAKAWDDARDWMTRGRSAAEAGQLRRGGVRVPGQGKGQKPQIEIPEHLQWAEPPKGVRKGPWFWLNHAFLSEGTAAEVATKRLGKAIGKKVENTDLDVRSAINEQSRLGRKIDDMVRNGIVDGEGNRKSIGLPALVDGIRKDGIDVDHWMAYRTAMRENELSTRGGIDGQRLEANYRLIDQFLDAYGDKVGKWDAEWQKFSDAHLDLYEQYGLKPEGWAAKIREENAFYWPLNPIKTDAQTSMASLNPQPGLASPLAAMKRAKGGKTYGHGLAQMASNIETVIREGEKNQSLLPFFSEAAKTKGMEDVAREIRIKPEAPKGKAPSADEMAEVDSLYGDDLDELLNREPTVDPFDGIETKEVVEGQDPVITLYENGKKRSFEIDPHIYKAILGTQPQEFDVVRRFLRGVANVAREGTTGRLNPFFAFIFNPLIDTTSMVVLHGGNPFRVVQGFGHAIAAKAGKQTELYKSATRNNVLFGRGSVRDFQEAQQMFHPDNAKAWDKAMQSRGVRMLTTVRDIYDAAREAVEEAPRLGMYQQVRSNRLRKGVPAAAAEKEAAQMAADLFNFGEASNWGRTLSGIGVPYANIVGQGIKSAARGFKRSPTKFMLRGAALLSAPAIAEYQLYKDDPEWQSFPNWQKYGAMTFRQGAFYGKPHEGDWVSIRMPAEMGVLFRGIPLQAMEAMETGDWGKAAKQQLQDVIDQYTPSFTPTAVALLGQHSLYAGSGATVDLRFYSVKGYPVKEDADPAAKAKAQYKYLKQQADTLFGSMGRWIAQGAAFKLSEDMPEDEKVEKKAPSVLQRYRPQPEVDKAGEAKKRASRASDRRKRRKARD
jgi:hypothetical protein